MTRQLNVASLVRIQSKRLDPGRELRNEAGQSPENFQWMSSKLTIELVPGHAHAAAISAAPRETIIIVCAGSCASLIIASGPNQLSFHLSCLWSMMLICVSNDNLLLQLVVIMSWCWLGFIMDSESVRMIQLGARSLRLRGLQDATRNGRDDDWSHQNLSSFASELIIMIIYNKQLETMRMRELEYAKQTDDTRAIL